MVRRTTSISSWSHDGSSIYFASKRTGRFEIWRAPTDTGTAVQITRNGGYAAFESPNGETLYFTMSEAGAEGLHAKRLQDGEEKQAVKEEVAGVGLRGLLRWRLLPPSARPRHRRNPLSRVCQRTDPGYRRSRRTPCASFRFGRVSRPKNISVFKEDRRGIRPDAN